MLYESVTIGRQPDYLGSLSADSSCELHVLWHDSHTLCMNCAQVGILKESNKVCLGCFLQSKNCRSLESKIGLKVLGDFSHKSLEWKLADKQLGGLLVPSDFTKCNGSRSVAMWFLDSSRCWGTLASSLGSKLLPWSFSTS